MNRRNFLQSLLGVAATGAAPTYFLPRMQIDQTRIFDGDKPYIEECRHLCRTDGFFLAPLLGFTKFDRILHGPVADLYIVKNKDLPIEDQHPIKSRMHLDPRATYKSTWGFVDTYQWIVNFPDMTIVNETATQPLARAQTTVIARKFYKVRGSADTLLQKLFPEWTIELKAPLPDDETVEDFNAPCRTYDQPDKTLDSTSAKSAQAGWHPWLLNSDDIVETNNSGKSASDNSRQNVIDRHNTNKNTVRPGGYVNLRGTRYHPFDLYGVTLQKMVPELWKTLVRSSIRVLSGARLIEGEFPLEDELEILFPGILTYDYLRQKFMEDYAAFMCQQQNDPMGGGKAIFPEPQYHSMLTPPELVPPFGETYVCWRLPFAGKTFMVDYAEGAASRYYGDRAYIVDAWRGDYTPSELAEKIVHSLKRNSARKLILERVPGYSQTVDSIRNEMARKNWSASIDLKEFENNDAERDARCKSCEHLMRAGRLKISTTITQSAETKTQFTLYGMVPRNGIIDCISRLSSRLPASTISKEISEEQKLIHELNRNRAMHGMIYGQGGMQVVEEAIATDTAPQMKKNSYGLRPMLGGLDG